MKIGSVILRGWRRYTSGTKKLTASFEDRNLALKNLSRSVQYPLLTPNLPEQPVARIQTLIKEFKDLRHTAQPDTPLFEVRGRIDNIRYAGKGLMFIDLVEGEELLQVVMNVNRLSKPLTESEICVHGVLRQGDSIVSVGRPWRTRAGELSLLSNCAIRLLSPSLHPLPDKSVSRTIRKHNRVVELKTFKGARDVLRARSLIINSIAEFLQNEDFLQVSTPHLSTQKGGAAAKSFETAMEDGRPLYLRVAPELWLKRLIISGFDRVFEIGNSYRNEGIDATHNPEFTTCEFYMSFADLACLKAMTQKLLQHVAKRVTSEFPQYSDNCDLLLGEWKTLDFVNEIETATSQKLTLDFDHLGKLCADAQIPVQSTDDTSKLLDRLGAHFVEPKCQKPTFVVNHPSVMAPLAKDFERNGFTLSKRFELFIGGKEYINAYEEENDPQLQLEKLKQQDSRVPDQAFVDALEWGLPPTGGWGLGIDRLVMLLTGSSRISDVLSFGDLNQVRRL